MNSSCDIDESLDEKSKSILEFSVEDTSSSEASFGLIVEESLLSNRPSLLSDQRHSSFNKNSRHLESSRQMSSSEDESYEQITRNNKRRVRIITSDSEDEFKLDVNPGSTSFTVRRAAQAIDSEEDSDNSAASLEDTSNNSKFHDTAHSFVEDEVESSVTSELEASNVSNTSNTNESYTKKQNLPNPEKTKKKIVENKSVTDSSGGKIETDDSDTDSSEDGIEENHSVTSLGDTSNNSKFRDTAHSFIEDDVESAETNELETSNVSYTSNTNRSYMKKQNLLTSDKIKKEIEENKSVTDSSGGKIETYDSDTDSSEDEIEENNSVHELSHAEIQDSTAENKSSNDSDVLCVEKTVDVIDLSSEEEDAKEYIDVSSFKNEMATKLKQVTLDSMVQNLSLKENIDKNKAAGSIGDTLYCTSQEYANQAKLVASLRTDVLRCKNTLRTLNLDGLPDKGALLRKRLMSLEINLATEDKKLSKMEVESKDSQKQKAGGYLSWEQLQANSNAVVPRTVGAQAMNTYTTQKALTMDRLKNLHNSLETCPSEDTLADDPKGLKVELMPHQKRALAWLTWREGQKPSGGILADDMGLGKTLTLISLVLKANEENCKTQSDSESESEEKSESWKGRGRNESIPGGTLVVCPATLIKQWEDEVHRRCKRNLLNVELFHGAKREAKAARLAKYDIVITTYKLVMGEYEKRGPLFRIKWARIILDEAHVVRNHKSQTSLAVCGLSGKSRWALTGTPVHNKELDLYALLKFLRCSPFDDLPVWKQWVANKNAGGQDRLNTVMTSIMLRRTKEQLQAEGSLLGLPEKKFELIEVTLDPAEKKVYQKVLIFSRTLFTQFLHQREAKNSDLMYTQGSRVAFMQTTNIDPEYVKMHKKVLQMHGSTEVKSHEILVLLLRLRQICCHPSLIVNMLDKENCMEEGIEDEDGVDIDILDKLNNLNLDDEEPSPQEPNQPENFSTAASRVLNVANPVFQKDRANGKIRAIQQIIEEKVLSQGDKVIIVSQWTSMLQVVLLHLKQAKFNCEVLDGKVPVPKRNEIVSNFNDPRHKTQVLLLSLTAGGVGLNLVGANHLLLLDLHWNPQLESQAQDRIYRVGQKKIVHIYKLVTNDTIEERIKALQENKLAMAKHMLSGTRATGGTKLTLNDLKMLFNVGV